MRYFNAGLASMNKCRARARIERDALPLASEQLLRLSEEGRASGARSASDGEAAVFGIVI